MMNKIEEAIIYATILHQGKLRKFGGKPYILHPLEVAQILSTMTDDEEIITAGILHDIVEDTDGTLSEIEKRFGERVALLVSSESEQNYPDESAVSSWQRRKEQSLQVLKNSQDIGVKMLWLADKLANIRSLSGSYSEHGEKIWQDLHQSDPEMQKWYYRTIGELVELSLNKTGAFKEYIKHVNFIWPGTFDRDKTRYKKYREVSVDGCRQIGKGAKGEVYRYDDELVIKVYNDNNTYRDVENEIAQSRRAFVLGIPTAISFGIVAVGSRYGAMYELLDSETISSFIVKDPGQVDIYAKIMAELARTIHGITVSEEDCFPPAKNRILSYVRGGIAKENEALANRCMELIDRLPETKTLIHGDFHTNNVFLQNGEPLLIDMDRLSTGHPIIEISDLYYFYVVLGEDDPSVVENFMGFSYATSVRFFESLLKEYFGTENAEMLENVKEKASLLCSVRMVNKIHKKQELSEKDRELIHRYMKQAEELADRLETLEF